MQVSTVEAKPPFVVFELRAVEDREASIKAGFYVPKDVAFAIITPAGSRDRIERQVDEWFDMLRGQVAEGRFPDNWLEAYKSRYRAWSEGLELPEDGTPIRNWAVPSPAQRRVLEDIAIHTIEQLASSNEEAIFRLGMGGRALVQRAKDYLTAQGSDSSKLAAELEALRVANAAKDEQLAEMTKQVAALVAKVDSLTKVKG